MTSGPPPGRTAPPVARPAPVARRAEVTGRAGLAASLASVVLTFAVAAAGPSVMEPVLPGGAGQPPWSFGLHLPAGLAIGLAAAALAAGATGLALCLHAARRGWAVSPRLLLGAGLIAAAALAVVPPFGSADHLSYAAYGRMVVTGHDPYTTTPAALARLGDPVARAVQDWRHSPSVYGSLATGLQALAAAAGGRSARLIVFALSLVNLAAFAGTGLLAHRLARGRRDRQMRAALLWTANPLLLQVLVAGAHVDAQAVAFAVAAVALFSFSLSLRDVAAVAPFSHSLRRVAAVAHFSFSLRDAPRASRFSFSLRHAARATRPPAGAQPPGHFCGRWRQRPQKNVAAGVNAHIRGPDRPVPASLMGAGAGALAGLAFAVKISLILVPAGLVLSAALAWLPRGQRRWRPFAVATAGLASGFAVIAAASFLPWGSQSLAPALHAGSYVSIGSPWRPLRSALHLAIGEATANDLVRAGAVLLAIALLALFARPLAALARHGASATEPGMGRPVGHLDAEFCPRPGDPPDGLNSADGLTLATATVFAAVFAWLVAWTYVLPWYDSLAWALLALLPWLPMPWAAMDWLLLARTTVLAFAYLPARGIVLPPDLTWLRTVIRSGITPALLLALTVTLVLVLRPRRAAARPATR